ncbi:NTP transferase domain-containing protein [Rhodospirillum sp. A1_3_36]|uniref:NTP transferase domain-containing protein n=1 Tax=Rhodospirillum sp. A1_3_36 TaxID=3391666 RepID=UPI0039A77E59
MIFGPTPLEEAEGAILAHAQAVMGKRLRKGAVLTVADIALLRDQGLEAVVAARLEPGDLHEDRAAQRIAAALQGPGLEAGEPFTGRANLFSAVDGVLSLDRARLERLNGLHEGLTVATLPPFARLTPKRMVATVKVIPFALPEAVVAEAEALAGAGEGEAPLVGAAFHPKRLVLVQTRLSDTADKMLDKTVRVTADRMASLGGALVGEHRCAHDAAELAGVLSSVLAEDPPDILAVAGASAIVDRGDVIPEALRLAGGVVQHLGMPVDPGNLLMLGRAGDTAVLGLPGCARSPAMNGFDWVLDRLCANLPATGREIMAMGVGGLLKEVAERPRPRVAEAHPAVPGAPRVGVVLLAAGLSSRMGGANKLLLDWREKPLVAHVADAALAFGPVAAIAVVGHRGPEVRAALEGRALTFVENPNPARGLSSSLKLGLSTLPGGLDAVAVCLGDMPGISPRILKRLVAAFDPGEGRSICLPTFGGARGNPALFDARFIPEILEVEGDRGARPVIQAHGAEVVEVPVDALAEGAGVLMDVDTPEAAAKLRGLDGA